MASHAPQTLLFPTNKGGVMANGYSSRLAKGQFGIVDKGASPTALGNVVTNTFSATPKDRLFELRLGSPDLAVTRSQSNKAWSSVPFKLSEIVDISVAAPSLNKSVDSFIIGYDGINASSAIVLSNGDNEVIDITLSGEAIGMLGYEGAKVTLKLYLEAPNTGSFTMHQIIEEAVARFKKMTLIGNVPVTDYININPVNSENPLTVTGQDYTFSYLTIADNGNYSDLGLVQAQYPNEIVKRESYEAGNSKYVILAETGTVLANYVKTNVALADADCDGEPEVTTSTVSTAWVAGDTCTAIQKNFKIQLADDDCGNDKLEKLQAFYPELDILVETATQSQDLTLTGTSGTANVNVAGVDYLATFASNLTTTASNFVTAHAAALLLRGITVTANAGVLTFIASTNIFPIITITNATLTLAGTLEAVESVGEATAGACQTVYVTKVFTDVVCEECSPLLRDLFVAEAPSPFEFVSWTEEAPVYSEDALMGIRVQGKYNIMAGSEEYRDEIPFIYSSTRISIANEAPGTINEAYKSGTNGRFAVKGLSVASEPEGLGMDLRDLEERSRVYFTGVQRHAGNNYAKLTLGEESSLDALVPHVVYSVRVRANRFAQSWSGEVLENFHYMISAPVGRHTSLETLINALATAASLPNVSAY